MRDDIYLELNYIRHGQISSISGGNSKGNSIQEIYDNYSLTKAGKKETKILAKELMKDIYREQTVILISSPIRRAIQTIHIIKQEFAKKGVNIQEEITLDFLKSARGLDELKRIYRTQSGNDLFDNWIKGALKLVSIEPYNKVKQRFIKFLKYILKMRKTDGKIRIITVAHAELPDYLMVKFFNKYGLGNVELFNMYFYKNKVLLSIKRRLNNGTFLESEKVIKKVNEVLE